MKEVIFGDAIRKIRIERGLTQERLAEGICSPSSLSRIENGGQVPSRKTFQLLMERLDGPGYSYAHFLSPEEYHKEIVKENLLAALEDEDYETACDWLGELHQVLDESDIKLRQFFEMSKLICFYLGDEQRIRGDYAKVCKKILEMGRPGWNIEESLKQYEDSLRIGRAKIDVRKKDWVEIWILNNMAIGMMWQQNYQEALEVLVTLYGLMGDDQFIKCHTWKARAVICNNMAICLLKMDRPQAAREYLIKASWNVYKEGGVSLLFHLMQTKMEISRALDDRDAFEKERLFVQQACRLMPNTFRKMRGNDKEIFGAKELMIL